MHDIFISYSSRNTVEADLICRVLETNGIKCWVAPRDIPIGSNYAGQIPAAIRNCRIFLLVMSDEAQTSIWVKRELDQAVNNRKIVVPVMLEDVRLNDEFNFYLTGFQRYVAYERTAAVLQNLVLQIKMLLNGTVGISGSVRTDGYYYTRPTDGQRTYFRFFSDGRVISASSSGEPADVSKWLNESYNGAAAYTVRGNEISFSVPVWGGNEIRYQGTVSESEMHLKGYSTYAKRWFDYDGTFISLEEIKQAEAAPKAEIIYMQAIDPQVPARIQETALRFDGFYCTKAERGWRTYYRFYPDGAMVSALTSATPAQAAKWLNLEKYEGGRVLFDGKTIRMDKPLSNQCHYFAELTLQGNCLTMSGFNTYSQSEMTEECTFLPFAEIIG